MVPRTEISGAPGAQNLESDWLWSLSDFSNGEGAQVFNPRVTDDLGYPFPSFKQTDGAIDVRTRGEFKMSPVSSLNITTGGATTTTTQGSATTTDTGSPTFSNASPVVESRATSSTDTSSTSHSVTLPSGIAANDLIVLIGVAYPIAGYTWTPPSGYTGLDNTPANAEPALWYRYADGTESGSVTFTSSTAGQSTWVAFRISGAENPAIQAPEAGTAASAISAAPNPPSLSPTGGSKNYLWIAAAGYLDGLVASAAPASYSNLQTDNSGGTTALVDVGISTAERSVAGASEDPGAFTGNTSANGGWAQTFAIHPASTTNARLNATEGVRVASTPGSASVTVTARFIAYLSGSDSATLRLRIFNNTDTAAVSNTTQAIVAPQSGQAYDLQLVFTATAAKEYHYIAELSAASGLGSTDYIEVDYITETIASTPSDVRLCQMGYNQEVVALHWDGTNIDSYTWDFTNNEWDLAQGNAINSLPIAHAASDKANYTLCANKIIYTWTTGAWTAYTAADASTSVAGMCISTNRIYLLGFGATRYLHEITLDGTPAFTENTADYKRVMSAGEYPDEESHDTTLRQVITAIPGGCRFIVNAAGGMTEIYEYSDGSGKPVAVLPEGFDAHSIYHYGGITYIGTQYISRGPAPAKTRSGIHYIASDGQLRFLGYLRFADPDDTRVSFIQAYGDSVYFLQGKYLWRYDTTTGGITLETLFGPGTDSNARSFAVMDTKKWACYSGEGVHVTGNTYPVNQSVNLYSPVWDYDVPDKDKVLLDVTVVTKPLPANTSVSLAYQDNEDGTWTTIFAPASAATTNATTHTFKAWGTAASPATVPFRNLQWRVGLKSTDGVSTNTVRSVTARVYVIEYQQVFDLALDLRADTSDHRSSGSQLSGRNKAEYLQTLIDNKSLVSFVNNYEAPDKAPDPETYAVIIEDPHSTLTQKASGIARVRLRVVA